LILRFLCRISRLRPGPAGRAFRENRIMPTPLSAHFLPAGDRRFVYVEKASPRTTNLQWLTYGVYELDGEVRSAPQAHPGEECLLFCWEGEVAAALDDAEYRLEHHDVLYVPRGAGYRLENRAAASKVIVCRSPAEHGHPPFHARWHVFSHEDRRIRRLKGKDVFLMFDVSEGADKLIAGYTLFQPFQRSYPPHNHTDQEEIYIFTSGHGAMEVYADEETKFFVHSVQPGDAATIPLLNYHPVFSQEEPLEFIWCIAGNRYWVGDKNKDFMDGKVATLTT
jgi:mannose-6-phosphate isomerase-like protein (cupin superfamily)